MNRKDKKILLDADVLSHFMASGNILLLPRIFHNNKVVLRIVADEIRRHPRFKQYINQLIYMNAIDEIVLPTDPAIIKEFAALRRKNLGPGESACMAVARYSNDIIASNNFRDIKQYCDLHGIEYLSTLDFVYEAYRSGIMSIADCDFMIYNLLTLPVPARLPCKTLEEYCKRQGLDFP